MAAAALLAACNGSSSGTAKPEQASLGAPVIETRWTAAATRKNQALVAAKKIAYELPEVRVYNSRNQLIFLQHGMSVGSETSAIEKAIRANAQVTGPTFGDAVSELEDAQGQPAAMALGRTEGVTIFDYWASWCVPCKVLEKQLRDWAAKQPSNSVRLVRVEADLMKADRALGKKVYMLKEGSDGKVTKVEVN
jgi:thiol-disulfide isomerase/thioredoxin